MVYYDTKCIGGLRLKNRSEARYTSVMELSSFHALLAPAGQEALAEAVGLRPVEKDFLSHLQNLEKRLPRELARAALEIAVLRLEALAKFPEEIAQRLYLTREAMEQATSWAVAAYRSNRFAGFDDVFDLGCSIGGDTIHLSRSSRVTGVDLDPLRLAMARENVRALGLNASFFLADLNDGLPFRPAPGQALFFDPARRDGHRRVFSVHDYRPPLGLVTDRLAQWPAIGVKISPGVDLAELDELACEVEFISENGDLKEAVLWFGPLKTARRRATVLPGGHTLAESGGQEAGGIVPPAGYLAEPDPAVIRAGLVTTLGAQLNASRIDETIAYLVCPQPVETPFARFWPIEDWLPFNLKKLRAYCRERNIGRITVKKRGSPITPEQLIAGLKLQGDVEKVLVLTRAGGQPVVLVCGLPLVWE